MNEIAIVREDIVDMDVDAIVNAANSGLRAGSGVCGAIFRAAGHRKLQAACDEIGHCPTGDATITPGFALKARYVIHTVGPIWQGGDQGEADLLASCYARSLDLAVQNGCGSIAFPLISSGIYGYPKKDAWRVALAACSSWLAEHGNASMKVFFCVISEGSLSLGNEVMAELGIA